VALEISEIGVYLSIGVPPPLSLAPDAEAGSAEGDQEAVTPARVEELVKACVQDVLETLRMLGER
jgi:hypothetical protein